MENFLSSLNDSQRAAVEYTDGPQLVIAGAGSGKTRVLTTKIAYLLQHGYHPYQIIALTFTKKAATEMQARIAAIVGDDEARHLWMGTFHALFARILRREAQKIGFPANFTIYDQTDSTHLLKNILKEMGLEEKVYRPNLVLSQISTAKNNLITPGMYAANAELNRYDVRMGIPRLGEIYQRYSQRLREASAMDFDDLLLYTNILFRDSPDTLAFYQQQFRYVLVDEYQDTNRAQHAIVEQLAAQHQHLTVVGDDAQSIYSFRGANIRNILDMPKKMPLTRLFKLEQNYRSTQTIVEAADSLIAKNKDQIEKHAFSMREQGQPIEVTYASDDMEEAHTVAHQMLDLHNLIGHAFSDMAVLYRTNAQSRILEETLRNRAIPYRIFGGLSFYQRKEIKDVVAYFRLIVNPSDEESFRRAVNYPARGIGATTLARLTEAATKARCSLFQVAQDPASYGCALSKAAANKVQGFAALITQLQGEEPHKSPYQMADYVIHESGIFHDLESDITPEGCNRKENVAELLVALQTFSLSASQEERDVHLSDFLTEVSLSGDVEPTSVEDKEEEGKSTVSLMTIHQAKGLEFRDVFIVGVEEHLLPSDMAMESAGGLEEERRLLYVALTRAQERCFLSYTSRRFRFGRTELAMPSRFLKDIHSKYLSFHGAGRSSSSVTYLRPTPVPSRLENTSASRPAHTPLSRYDTPSLSRRPASISPRSTTPAASTSLRSVNRPDASPSPAPAPQSLSFHDNTYRVGNRVYHSRFGKGTITALEDSNLGPRLTIHFDSDETKTIMLKFAKITPLT